MTSWRKALDYLPAVGLFLIGLLISAAAIHHVRHNQETILHQDFYSSAEDRLDGIRIKLAVYLTELNIVASHFGASPDWPSHFSAMADAITANEAGVTAVVWAPRVPGYNLEAYRRELAQRHGTDVAIWEFTDQGDTRATTPADEHFPLALLRPPTAISALGLDIGSDPARRGAIEASRDSGKPAATPVVTPLTSLRVAPVLIYQSLYDVTPQPLGVAERRAHFRGVVGMAIDLEALIGELLTGGGAHSVDSRRLDLMISDTTGGTIFPVGRTNPDPNDREEPWIFEQVVDFAGRQWHFRFAPAPGTFLIDPGPTQILTLIGLTGSFAVGLLGSAGIQRRRRAEALTRELTETNQALQDSEQRLMEGERIGEIGYWEFDVGTREGWFSPQINRMFGLSPDEPVSLEKLGAMLHPEDRASAWHALSTIESGGGNLPVIPHRIIRPDGDVRWLVANGELRRDIQGRAEKITAVTQDVTARQRMLNRLAEQEAEFQSLFHNNPLPMMVFAVESLRCIEVNDIAVHRYGFNRTQWLGRHLAEMGPDHDPAKLRAMVDAMVASGETFARPGDWRHYLADGSVIDVEIASHRVRFRGIDALLTTCIDMTERKRVTRALEVSEQRLLTLMEAIPDGLLTVNSELHIESFNGAAERIFGYHRDEVLGRPVTCLIPEDARLKEPGFTRRLPGSDGKSWLDGNTHRITARSKAGRTFPIALSVSEASFGDRQMSIGVVRDISGEIRLQNALEESERIFRSVFEDAGVGIATTDAEGRFLRVNRRFREIVDLRESDLLGAHFYDITNLAEKGDAKEGHLEAFRSGDMDTLHEEYRLTSKAGTPLWVSVTVSAIRRPARSGSDVSSFVVVIEDIAQRREASERLALSQRLEAVGQLTGGIAHDFNNMLTAVLGNLQLARCHPEPEHLRLRLNAAE
ncbi:MAG: PAS domain S-box protein, partial [Pseudomonadota bacterium]|nr:PAS domain S-box protein [Pseudomonadota bacterium]